MPVCPPRCPKVRQQLRESGLIKKGERLIDIISKLETLEVRRAVEVKQKQLEREALLQKKLDEDEDVKRIKPTITDKVLDRIDPLERADLLDHIGLLDRSDEIYYPEEYDHLEKFERPEEFDRQEELDRVDELDRIDKLDRVDELDRPEKFERPEKLDRPDEFRGPEEFDRVDELDRIDKLDRVEKFDRPDELDRPDRADLLDKPVDYRDRPTDFDISADTPDARDHIRKDLIAGDKYDVSVSAKIDKRRIDRAEKGVMSARVEEREVAMMTSHELYDSLPHTECQETCPLKCTIRKIEERQRVVDHYLLTKGFNYFDDICTCSLSCIFHSLKKDCFVKKILTSATLFFIGLKLCSELKAWYLPIHVS